MKEIKATPLRVALNKYLREAQEAKLNGDKDALKEANWKVKYFKDKIKQKERGEE